MSAELYAVVAISGIAIAALVTLIFLMRAEHERVLSSILMKAAEKELSWNAERADLLNRIQAGNYAEYKTQEIRLVKAQQGEEQKKQPQIEPL